MSRLVAPAVRYALALVVLTAVWVGLWGDLTLANVLGGVLAGGFLLMAFPLHPRRSRVVVRPFGTARFLGYFAWLLVRANVDVVRAVIRPSRVREGIVAVEVSTSSDWLLVLLANCVTLTPGTLTVDLRREPDVLYVHVLCLGTLDDARRDVLLLQRSILRAFGPAGSVDDVERRLAGVAA
ncbi:MAG: Na+/H+ antiporter subunit E [Acidimicrobiales bacterium]|nr:Na+/H+ antiporter subunit E [Acidimicrobiales bacterium]